jgi:hypothetical protein
MYSTDVVYQLSLDIFNDECKNWIHSDTKDKVKDINKRIANIINSQCGIDVKYYDTGSVFRCRTAQDGHVVYNVHLSQTANTTTVIELVTCMDSWATKPAAATSMFNSAQYALIKDCSGVLMDSVNDPFICPWLPPPPSKSKLGVGEGIGIGIVIGIIVAILILGVLLTRRIVKRYNYRQGEHIYNNQPRYGATGVRRNS